MRSGFLMRADWNSTAFSSAITMRVESLVLDAVMRLIRGMLASGFAESSPSFLLFPGRPAAAGCERRGHLRGVRRNQIDAAVAGNHLLVIAERALAGGLAFESRTKFFGAIILRLRGLFFCGR